MFSIEGGIEVRIIVHLELEVDAKTSTTGLASGQQFRECRPEIFDLLFDHAELKAALFNVLRTGIRSIYFLLHVILFERHNGQAVDDGTRCFTVHRCIVSEGVTKESE